MASGVAVGLLGLGVVGGGVYEALTRKADLIAARCGRPVYVKRALVRDVSRARPVAVDPARLTTNPDDVLADPDITVVVEVLGGERPAYDYVRRAILAGKSVVTANKDMLARHGAELLPLAAEQGVELAFEATVGGAIPIVAAIRRSLVANEIQSVQGIVNGTTNYILSEMESKGRGFASVLKEAQELGYAEPDPTNDVAGYDSRYKLVILCALAFGTWLPVDEVPCEGIERVSPADIRLAGELGYTVKLLATARRAEAGIEASVRPALVPSSAMLAGVRGVFNAVQVRGDLVGDMLFYGRGAGAQPTASAIVGDLVSVIRGERSPTLRAVAGGALASGGDVHDKCFVRLETAEGDVAQAAKEHLAGAGIALEGAAGGAAGELALLTGAAPRRALRQAIDGLAAVPGVRRVASVLAVVD